MTVSTPVPGTYGFLGYYECILTNDILCDIVDTSGGISDE